MNFCLVETDVLKLVECSLNVGRAIWIIEITKNIALLSLFFEVVLVCTGAQE